MLLTDVKIEARGRVRPMARYDAPVVAAMMARLVHQRDAQPSIDAITLGDKLATTSPLCHGLVVERFGYVVGYATMAVDEIANALVLQQIFIIEGSRGRGLGRALVEAAADLARQAGYRRIVARAPTGRAYGFYDALHFDDAGRGYLSRALV